MSKRKNSDIEKNQKKQRTASESKENEYDATITKPSKRPEKQYISWPDPDIVTLLAKIEENIPQDDGLSYSTRVEMLNWDRIAFKAYSAAACRETWSLLSKQVRKFRLLGEIVKDVKEWVSKKPKFSSPRHPSKPKQPYNSYMFFITEKRQDVTEQHPEMNSVEVARKLGQMFKELTEEQKAKYVEKARIAKQEYLEKMQTFYEQHPEMMPKEATKKKKKKPLEQLEPGQGPPEKPKTPFELFLKVESEKENSDCSKFAQIQKYRERWNEFNDKEKYFWIKWAEEQHEKYLDDLKEYIKEHPNYEPEKIKPIITKKDQKIKDRCLGKPSKPPHSAYQLCCKMILERKDVQNLNKKELMNYISEKWKSMPDDEKNEYKTRVEQMWEEYQIKFEDYLKTLPPEERDKIREQEGRHRKSNKSETKATPKKAAEPKNKLEKPPKPPSTPYKYFSSVYKGVEDPLEVWNAMTKKERKGFKKELNEKRNNYLRLFEKYLKSLSKEELEQLGASLNENSSSESEDESRGSEND